MLICFFDQEGIVHREFVPPGMTVNANFYCDILRRLRENVRRKRPQKWQHQNLIIHHDNAPAHRSFKASQFLAKNNMTVIPHSPYSPELAPCDFFLFPMLKLRMKGRRFDTVEGIQEESQRVFDTIPKKRLPGMLPSMAETLGPLYSCKMGVLWRRWRNLTSKVSKLLLTSTVLELLDTPLYIFIQAMRILGRWGFQVSRQPACEYWHVVYFRMRNIFCIIMKNNNLVS